MFVGFVNLRNYLLGYDKLKGQACNCGILLSENIELILLEDLARFYSYSVIRYACFVHFYINAIV